MMTPTFHQGALNVVAWILAIAGIIAFTAAVVGLALVIIGMYRNSPVVTQEVDGTYYALGHLRHSVWSLLIVMIMSALVAIGGYVHTDQFINRMVGRVDVPPTPH